MKQKVIGSIFISTILLFILFGYHSEVQAAKTIKMNPGQTKTVKVPPNYVSVKWSSNKKKIVTVNKKGMITAKSVGKAVITAKVFGKKYKYKVIVKKPETGGEEDAVYKIKIKAGNKEYSAKLYKNETTKALIQKFPMTITMKELNENEKYYYLSEDIPVNSSRPSKIHTGDLMLYGSDCLVLFYETFSTSYSYTSLGYIENTKGLEKALGDGNVKVTFEIE